MSTTDDIEDAVRNAADQPVVDIMLRKGKTETAPLPAPF
jgi:hypothetical protein